MSWVSTAWNWYANHAGTINPIVAFFGAVGAFITAAVIAWSSVRNARTAALRHEEQTRADWQRRITESYSKAVEQLGSEKIEVCCGGIYALERISRESPDDHWPVMETLTAFVRERARWKESVVGCTGGEIAQPPPKQKLPTHIDAAISVIARRKVADRKREARIGRRLDLRSTDLRGALLEGGHLEDAVLDGAHLEGAFLPEAHLEDAVLVGAHLEGINLSKAHLEGTKLGGAHLERARLGGAHLEGADLLGAHLEGAFLKGATGLVAEQLVGAYGDAKTLLPEGVARPPLWLPSAF